MLGVDLVSWIDLKRADRCTIAVVAPLTAARALLQVECVCMTKQKELWRPFCTHTVAGSLDWQSCDPDRRDGASSGHRGD